MAPMDAHLDQLLAALDRRQLHALVMAVALRHPELRDSIESRARTILELVPAETEGLSHDGNSEAARAPKSPSTVRRLTRNAFYSCRPYEGLMLEDPYSDLWTLGEELEGCIAADDVTGALT